MKGIQTKYGLVKVDNDIYDRLQELNALVYRHHERYYVKYKDANNKFKELALTSFINGVSGRDKNTAFKDNDCKNCTRSNLIVSNKAIKKSKNKKYYGVNKNRDRYQARISKDGTRLNVLTVGTYLDEQTAAIAYNKAMDLVYGEGNYLKNELDVPKEVYDEIYNTVSIDLAERVSRQGTNQKLSGASSIYTGVCKTFNNGVWSGKWVSNIYYGSKNIYLGRFESEILAAQAYNQAAIYLYGEEAKINNVPNPMHYVIDIEKLKLKVQKEK